MTCVPATINDRWELQLLPHREEFHRVRPGWEAPRLAHMYGQTRVGDVVMDVGAEQADLSALYRQWVGDEGSVILVEPQPAYYPNIRATWTGNGYAEVPLWFGGFASDTSRLEPLTADPRAPFDVLDDGWPRCSLGPLVEEPGFRHLAQQADTNAQTRLDDWCIDNLADAPDVIVMDIEGAELRALEGCKALLEDRLVRLFYVSLHPQTLWEWYQATSLDIHRLMEGHGYRGVYLGQGSEEYWCWEAQS